MRFIYTAVLLVTSVLVQGQTNVSNSIGAQRARSLESRVPAKPELGRGGALRFGSTNMISGSQINGYHPEQAGVTQVSTAGSKVTTRVFDANGKIVSVMESQESGPGFMPTAQETAASIEYIKRGAKRRGIDTSDWGWNATNPTNCYASEIFWSEHVDDYCTGVIDAATSRYGLQPEKK